MSVSLVEINKLMENWWNNNNSIHEDLEKYKEYLYPLYKELLKYAILDEETFDQN